MKDAVHPHKITVTIHNSIPPIPSHEWDDLVRHTMCCTSAWMNLFEHSLPTRVTPYYVTAYRNNQLIGGAVCYKTRRKFWKIRIPIIAFMCLFSEEKIFIKEGEDYTTVLSHLHNGIEEIARKEKVFMISAPYLSHEAALEFFKKKRYALMKGALLTRLDVEWKTFEDYLRSLSRKAKKSIRHTVNQGRRRGLILEHSHDFSDSDHLFTMYRANLERHNYEHTIPFTAELFQNFEKYVKDQVYILRCFYEGDLLGYWIYFFDGKSANMVLSAIDYTYPREYDAYFNICYDAVREMIDKGCSFIDFGATTYEVKRRIGCTMKGTMTAIKVMNPLLNRGVHLLAFFLNKWVERRL
jgi:predicted N-acyltransferase